MLNINVFAFFMSFAIGLLYCYVTTPPPEIVYKFPSPLNSGKVVYKESNNKCYKYNAEKVACPINRNIIKMQPNI